MGIKEEFAAEPVNVAWDAARECGVLPSRFPTGSLRNQFRAAATRTMTRLVAKQFNGDSKAFADALRAEWESFGPVGG